MILPSEAELQDQSQVHDLSVTIGSLSRFTAELAGAAFGLVTGAVTARVLGPTGKGELSTLSYLVALFAPACAFGLGEAIVALLGQRRVSLSRALSGASGLLLPAMTVGFVGVLLSGGVVIGFEAHQSALVIAAGTLPVITLVTVVGIVLDSQQRLVWHSLVRVGIAIATSFATVLLVAVWHLGIAGGVAAILVGWGAGLCVLLGLLAATGALARPRWDRDFLRLALPLGVPVQMSYLLIVAAARVDLLIVLALRGKANAGVYSVALTLGQLVTYAPLGLAAAAFPRLALISAADAAPFAARVYRVGLAAAFVSGIGLAVIVPVVTPIAFGRDFSRATSPALILLGAGMLSAGQWMACRFMAARGHTRPLAESYGASLAAMVALDLALVPTVGIRGAAISSLFSSLLGLGVAVRRLQTNEGVASRSLVPTSSDFVELLATLRVMSSAVRRSFD